MSRIACYRVGSLLSRGPVALSEAERLHVESHRASCRRCRENIAFDERLRGLISRAGEPARSSAIDGVIARAFAATPPSAPPARPRGWLFAVGPAAAAAAAIAVAAMWGDGGGDALLAIEPAPEPALEVAPPEGELAAAATRVFAHAEVTATSASRYRWSADSRVLELERGALRVRVTPNTGRSFTVATSDFAVVVLGTEFEVDASGVRVIEGVVEVRTRSGELLADRLGAGDSWRLEPEEAEEPELSLDEDLTAMEPASVWLDRAQQEMRAQRFARARGAIRRALAAGPTRRERAEAGTLRAEIALATGDVGRAIVRYREVAEEFRRYSQGESALFAAARLEAKRGRASQAAALLRRYQTRYPSGRFAREVARKLDTLGGAR